MFELTDEKSPARYRKHQKQTRSLNDEMLFLV